MTYYIYRHIVPNGKSYIGKTKNTKNRYQNGKGYRQCTKFWKAINEFGWENIKHEILATTEDECIARKLEKEFIKKYDAIKNGYNSCNDITIKRYIPRGDYTIYGQYDLNGNLIKKYIGNQELQKNGYLAARIRWCINGKIKTAYGFKWKVEGKCKKTLSDTVSY